MIQHQHNRQQKQQQKDMHSPSRQRMMNTSPRGPMNPSGLFDIEPNDSSFLDPLTFEDSIFDSHFMDDNCNLLDSFSEKDVANLSAPLFDLNLPLNTSDDKKIDDDSCLLLTPSSECNAKFEDLYENNLDLNLYLPGNSPNSLSSLSDLVPMPFDTADNLVDKEEMSLQMPSRQTSFNFQLDFDDEQLKFLMTPSTEKLCFEFIQSPDQQNIGHFVDDELSRLDNETKLDNVLVDHDYAIASKKRKISEPAEDVTPSGSQKTDGVFKAPDSAPVKAAKKQRTRGIYRADDVKSNDDLQNYLERRRKNNISSKASRQTKKHQYVEMDAKSEKLEKENDKLRQAADEFEDVIRIFKDALLEKYTGRK